jgi:hypothetical protein
MSRWLRHIGGGRRLLYRGVIAMEFYPIVDVVETLRKAREDASTVRVRCNGWCVAFRFMDEGMQRQRGPLLRL